MDIVSPLAIITLAALIHASFQLSVSVLTLLSGHAIGRKTSHARLVTMAGCFVAGAALTTVLALTSLAYFVSIKVSLVGSSLIPWAISCGLLIGLGVAVWAFYYRREPGTTLWLPRGLARYLSDRAKATKQGSEAFGLGVTSVIAEALFIFGPLLVTALALQQLSPFWQLIGVGLYSLLSLSFILIVYFLIGSGHKLSTIQRWREENKRFLQFVAGGGLVVLGFYVYIMEITSTRGLV